MTGRRWNRWDAQREIGAAVLAAREAGVCWKELVDFHGRSRWTLERYARRVSREKMHHQSLEMHHHGARQDGAAP